MALSFTRQDLRDAITATMARAKTDRQHECIEHAAAWLAKFEGQRWTLKVDYLIIRSESSDRFYTLQLGDVPICNCPARKPCWHIALAVILQTAARHGCPDCGGELFDSQHPFEAMIITECRACEFVAQKEGLLHGHR